jgi:hypothetical protein
MNERQSELERRRLRLVLQSDRHRRRLGADGAVADHWIRIARWIVVGASRAARLYRYWNHSTQP